MAKRNGISQRAAPKHLDPRSLKFSLFTAEDIRNLSVVKICTPLSFNILGHPLRGGLYDPSLGPLNEDSEHCGTCGGNYFTCTGHFGHIDLPVPVVNPLFHRVLWSILRQACLKCFTLQIPEHTKLLLAAKLKLLEEGFYSDLQGLDQEVSSVIADSIAGNIETECVREIIDDYFERLHQERVIEDDKQADAIINTKNLNMQWHIYIESILKEFKAGKVCINCHESIPKISVLKNRIMIAKAVMHGDESRGVVHRTESVLLMPDQSKKYMRRLWDNEREIFKVMIPCLGFLENAHPTDVFYSDVIPVLPPIVRPVSFVNGMMSEHPQSQVYKYIIQDCLVLRNVIQTIQDGDSNQLSEEGRQVLESIRGDSAVEKLHYAWTALQSNVDHLMDREMSKTSESMACQGLKQVIEKKAGVIRMHMMGKRVNFAARSVITPDPNLNIDEIGIPEAFAMKLTYPVPVTPWNVTELRQLVINGPDKHPGAVMIEGENGFTRRIDPNDKTNREAIAKRLLTGDRDDKSFLGVKIVHRHLQNGDILLLNRQPTLHKPSIMAHKARILKGEKTLRLHYSNCKAYNADFDGDEMNAHYPQNELARSEGYFIANVSNQYLVPKDGTPLGGLIQDHVISGVRLTLRGKFFNKEDYMQLVYSGLSDHRGDIKLLPPAIIKPVRLWSGKQVVSTVIINTIPKGKALINLTASAKINAKNWEMQKPRKWKCGVPFSNEKTMSEAEVIIRNGELLTGVLDKTHYGATPYGLIHCIYELYGGVCSCKMLSSFGKLFQSHLQQCGFTLGIEDILVVPKSDAKRQEIIKCCREIGDDVQKAALELPDNTAREIVEKKMEENNWKKKTFRALVDRKYKSTLDTFTNAINKTCLPAGLLKKFPHNNLQLMVQSGAKGSTVNTMQISCLLGQIELEGKRPPLMISGKALPSFPAYDSSPRAGGFIDGRFMTGIQPQEFFYHCMAGREGLIDTAVKTSRSGYLQRCLIKHLEGLTINYDSTVRDSDGSLIQMYYGEDGLDIPKSRFLKKEQMDFLLENKDAIVDKELLESLKETSETQKINKLLKKLRKWKIKNGGVNKKNRVSEFTIFSDENKSELPAKLNTIDADSGRSQSSLSLIKKWISTDDDAKKSYRSRVSKCPEPLTSKYRQDLDFGVLSEHFEDLIDDYLKTRQDKFTTAIGKDEIRDLMCFKVMKTLCPPGEPVGLLAAQSVGEPSTQMTLNTFHFAGRGEMNVTLGIPRLREILMMASKNIKTPSMEVPFRSDLKNLSRQSNKLRLKLTKCYLADVLKTIRIDRKMDQSFNRRLEYTLMIEYLPHKYYKHEFNVTSKQIIEKTENLFFKELFIEIKKVAKLSGTLLQVAEEKKVNSAQEDSMLDDYEGPPADDRMKTDMGEMHESSDEDEAAEDADATAVKSKSKHQENQEYDDPEEDEVEEDEDDEEAEEEIKEEANDEMEVDEVGISYVDELAAELKKADVCNKYTYALEYDFDARKYHWCKFKFWLPLKMLKIDLPMIIRTVAKKLVLWQTPLIKRAFTFQNAQNETLLKTDGINIVEMFKYDGILDLKRLYSNDIYGISQTYGIEAANRVIVKEIKDVFKAYGITVDLRHLSLIADYMTFDGTFSPLSRKGMEDSASPLQQMSFESSLVFLKAATLQAKRDDLSSPSSRLMLGQPCKTGTGSFDVCLETQLSSFQPKSTRLTA